jgi:hypothetical protein
MRGSRQEKIERELAAAEADFRAKLLLALTRCAAGQWGLFAQNDHLDMPARIVDRAYQYSGAKDLIALGQEIEAFRNRLGMAEPFPLFARLLELRGRKTSNDPGEAKQAKAWLKELSE